MTTASLLDVQRPSPFVARVFLNRPEVRNAFNETTIAELTRLFTELSADLFFILSQYCNAGCERLQN